MMKGRTETVKKALILMMAVVISVTFSIGNCTEQVSAATKKPGKVKWVSAKAVDSSSVVLKWKKVSKAKGYQIYLNGKAVKRLSGKKSVTWKCTGLRAGTKYSFRVRAYSKIKNKRVYGKFSAVKTVAAQGESDQVTDEDLHRLGCNVPSYEDECIMYYDLD